MQTDRGTDVMNLIVALCNFMNLPKNEAVHQLFIDFKKAYDLVRREGLV
jgi:hypothetical protein